MTWATPLIAIALGSLLVVAGVSLLIWPAVAIAYWPWPTTPLTLRIFAAWFAAFGAGLLWFWVERERSRVRHVANLMMAAAGLDLLMMVIHRNDLTGTIASGGVYCFH